MKPMTASACEVHDRAAPEVWGVLLALREFLRGGEAAGREAIHLVRGDLRWELLAAGAPPSRGAAILTLPLNDDAQRYAMTHFGMDGELLLECRRLRRCTDG